VERVEHFRCSSCNHAAKARIRTEDGGVANAYERNAARNAVADAAANAEADVHTALALARCPKCGRRDPAALAKHLAWTLVPALVFAALAVAMASIPTLGSIGWLCAVGCSIVALVILVGGVRALARIDREVTFE
jgi:hypothetical protein